MATMWRWRIQRQDKWLFEILNNFMFGCRSLKVTLDCLSLGEEVTIQQIMVVPGRDRKDCRRVKKKVQP